LTTFQKKKLIDEKNHKINIKVKGCANLYPKKLKKELKHKLFLEKMNF